MSKNSLLVLSIQQHQQPPTFKRCRSKTASSRLTSDTSQEQVRLTLLRLSLRFVSCVMAIKDLDPENLQQALLGMSQKSEEAFKLFFLHYQTQLYPFIRNLVRDDDLANSVVSDVLLYVCRNPEAFEHRSKFSTWLCSIARNKAIDALRANTHSPQRGAVPLDEPEALALPDPAPWSNVLVQLDRLQTQQQLQRCMNALPPQQLEVASLAMLEEWTETEVANELGCPVGTVKSRLFAARKALQKCLNGWYQEMKRV
jgi:RNA polymerase sigma factor (sigma-70 family)